MINKINYVEYFNKNTLRLKASRRGGGIEIDVSDTFGEGAKISAFQNYLGGGLLGSIQSDYNFTCKDKDKAKLKKMQDALMKYFHNITNEEAGEYDEWNEASFEDRQKMPKSAF